MRLAVTSAGRSSERTSNCARGGKSDPRSAKVFEDKPALALAKLRRLKRHGASAKLSN